MKRKFAIQPTQYAAFDGWLDWEILCDNLLFDIPDGGRIVEVGVYQGRASVYMHELLAYNRPQAKCTQELIDIYEPVTVTNPDGTTTQYFSGNEIYFLVNKLDLVQPNGDRMLYRAKPLRGPSHEICRKYRANEIDFLFIDGDHSAWGCYGDMLLTIPNVKAGGSVVIHDYHNPVCPEVTSAIDLFVSDNPDLKVNFYESELYPGENKIFWFKAPKDYKYKFRKESEFEKAIQDFPPYQKNQSV